MASVNFVSNPTSLLIALVCSGSASPIWSIEWLVNRTMGVVDVIDTVYGACQFKIVEVFEFKGRDGQVGFQGDRQPKGIERMVRISQLEPVTGEVGDH